MEYVSSFFSYFSKLFVTLDGIGLAPIFIVLTATATPKWRNLMMNKSVIVAFFVLLLFAYAGSIILDLLDISLTALKIAGGILLLLMAIDLVLGSPDESLGYDSAEQENSDDGKRKDISVFPLAIPLLSGPATITMLTICMKNAQGMPVEKALIIAALALNLLVCWLIMKFAGMVSKFLGKTGLSVINKIVGILLAAMSCEFLMNGLIEILKSVK